MAPDPGCGHAGPWRLGNASSLPPLRALLERGSSDAATRALVQHAIEKIRQRLPDAADGHVSLAGSEGGQLTVADAQEQGRVSVIEE